MQERGDHLTAAIGTSGVLEKLRGHLVGHGLPHVGTSGHLRGIRRHLIGGRDGVVVLCIALDRRTLGRYGVPLRTLLADLQGFPGATYSVGVFAGPDLDPRLAELGCDLYVGSCAEATNVIRRLQAQWHGGGDRFAGPPSNRFAQGCASGVWPARSVTSRTGPRRWQHLGPPGEAPGPRRDRRGDAG